MGTFRVKDTGAIMTTSEIVKLNSNTVLPKVWSTSICESLGIDPVLASPAPTVEDNEIAVLDGAKLDTLGNWVQKWVVRPKYTEYTDGEDVVHTVAMQESAALLNRNSSLLIQKQKEVREDFVSSLAPDVEVDGVHWDSGFDSSLALDGATRIAENMGLLKVTLHDTNNLPHSLSIPEAKAIAAEIGVDYQGKFAVKQSRLVQLAAINLSAPDADALIAKV